MIKIRMLPGKQCVGPKGSFLEKTEYMVDEKFAKALYEVGSCEIIASEPESIVEPEPEPVVEPEPIVEPKKAKKPKGKLNLKGD